MKEVIIKNIFIEGAISPSKIAESIAAHQSKTDIGAHDIFLGLVRADVIEERTVTAIEFTAQQNMANSVCHEIREEVFEKFDLSCMHIYHSIGTVKVGEVCLFVLVSGAHRKSVFEAMPYLVDAIKANLPIFGKELFEDDTYQWKVNQ